LEESTPEYEKLKNYIFELENHLAEAQKQAYRLVKRHRGILVDPFIEFLSYLK
jgi:sorting nexin-1/2